jgi:hypothetical protein
MDPKIMSFYAPRSDRYAELDSGPSEIVQRRRGMPAQRLMLAPPGARLQSQKTGARAVACHAGLHGKNAKLLFRLCNCLIEQEYGGASKFQLL